MKLALLTLLWTIAGSTVGAKAPPHNNINNVGNNLDNTYIHSVS